MEPTHENVSSESSFIGVGEGVTEEQSAPATEVAEPTSEPEAVVEEATEEASEPEVQAQPEDQEFEAELEPYMKRYRVTKEQIEANPSLKFMLIDKMNSDKEIARLREEEKKKAETEAAEPEEEKPEEAPADLYKQYQQFADTFVTDEGATMFGKALDAAVKSDGTTDNKVLAKAFATFGVELVHKAISQILTPDVAVNLIEAKFPGYSGSLESNLMDNIWGKVADESLKGVSRQQALEKAQAEIPEFEKLYSHLPRHQQLEKQFQLAVKLARGQQVTVEDVKAAADAAKKQAEQANRSAKNAAGLGAGKTTNSNFSPKKDESSIKRGYQQYLEREGSVFG